MSKRELPPIANDLAPRRKIDLSAIRPNAADDEVVDSNSRKIGTEWGAQTSLGPADERGEAVPMASLRIEVPEYLDRELAFRAVELRTTKQYLVIKALRDGGFKVEEGDLVEDRRRSKTAKTRRMAR